MITMLDLIDTYYMDYTFTISEHILEPVFRTPHEIPKNLFGRGFYPLGAEWIRRNPSDLVAGGS